MAAIFRRRRTRTVRSERSSRSIPFLSVGPVFFSTFATAPSNMSRRTEIIMKVMNKVWLWKRKVAARTPAVKLRRVRKLLETCLLRRVARGFRREFL